MKKYLSSDQFKIYNLIWSRALSSQMESAKFDRKTITISSNDGKNVCKASGSVIKFDGYLKLLNVDDENNEEKILPDVKKGDVEINDFIDVYPYFTVKDCKGIRHWKTFNLCKYNFGYF